MKKIYFVTIIILFVVFNESDSQLIRSYGGKFGVTSAGQNWKYSGVLSDVTLFNKYRTGVDIGGYVEWFDVPVLSLLTEVHYIQKGCKDEFAVTSLESPEITGEKKSITPRIDYLSFPLLVKLRFDTPIITLYGIAGYRIDILVGKNIGYTSPVFDDLKSTDHGATVGFGVGAPFISGYCIGGEFRYSFSSQEIFSNQNLTVKNKSMEILLTVGF